MAIDFARCIFGKEERDAVNRVLDGYWLASGKENEEFEREFAKYIGTNHAVCVNSGSSANLLALACLELPKGSKVLTSACGFPATLAPILHLGLEPILVDYDIETLNIDIKQCIEAIKKYDIKAVIIAHTLGVPVDLRNLKGICQDKRIPIIEDCCEAVGAKIDGFKVGTCGKLGTFSFYPSHQMTALGGGGLLVTNRRGLVLKLKSMRDWGKRWDWNEKLGDKVTDYSFNNYYPGYTYETLGYNMKLPEANAAFGREQLKRLDGFVAQRMCNFRYLADRTKMDCTIPSECYPSYFGFPMIRKDRNKFGEYLESKGIRHRPFFAGNITRHKPFNHLKGEFPIADLLMQEGMFIGCWPGLTEEELSYMVETINAYDSDISV